MSPKTAMRRPLHFMARSTLFDPPFAGWLLRHLNGVPLQREGLGLGGFRSVVERLERGFGVLVFPEGIEGVRKTIAQRYRLQTFRVGYSH